MRIAIRNVLMLFFLARIKIEFRFSGLTEVLKAYQNQGIATSMLKKMFTQLKALRFDAVLAFQIAGRGGKIYPKTCRI